MQSSPFHHNSGKVLRVLVLLVTATARLALAEATAGVETSPLAVIKSRVGFTPMDATQTGIHLRHGTDSADETPFVANRGVALGDFDADGRCDIFFFLNDGRSTLYRNLGGWRFEDATARASLKLPGRTLYGGTFADLDGDGDLDLVALSLSSTNSIHINDGRGNYQVMGGFPWAPNPGGGSITAALADIDGDADLDLYVANYRRETLSVKMAREDFDRMVKTELERLRAGGLPSEEFSKRFAVQSIWQGGRMDFFTEENGVEDALYLNQGAGNFKWIDNTREWFRDPKGEPRGFHPEWTLGATAIDVNDDGYPDIFASNDFMSRDHLWLNDGSGRFQMTDNLALRHTSRFSMGVAFADFNLDGQLDFIVADMLKRSHTARAVQAGAAPVTPMVWGRLDSRPQYLKTTLMANRGDGTFSELGQFANIAASDWAWSPMAMDADLDGLSDVLITTGVNPDLMDGDAVQRIRQMGNLSDEQRREARKVYPSNPTHNLAFRNLGNFRFEDVSAAWGFTNAAVSGGMALGDLDGDGDLDVVINNTGSAPEIYRNECDAARIAVRLRGRSPNTQGIGAKVTLLGGAVPSQWQEVIAGGVYTSGSDPLRVFACGTNTSGLSLEVLWRNGTRTLVADARPNTLYTIDEAQSARPWQRPKKAEPQPWFADESAQLQHTHVETPFDDWGRQPLLPRRLSQQGPGLCWWDADGDGREDLIIGTGAGGKLAVCRNEGGGRFRLHESPPLGLDQTAVLGSPWGVLVGLSSYELNGGPPPSAQSFSFREGDRWHLGAPVPPTRGSPGALSLVDLDRDGTLELLVGQRGVAGRYPEGTGVSVFKRAGDQWQLDEPNSKTLSGAGMVGAMTCGDLSGDGWPEVCVVSDWGPIRVYANEKGALKPWDAGVDIPDARNLQRTTSHRPQAALSDFTGFWTSVVMGDFDGDGRLDLACGNWGLNTKHEHTYEWEHPLRLYHGDVDANGTVDLFESYHLKERGAYVPDRDWNSVKAAVPVLGQRIKTYRQYGLSTVGTLLGEMTNKVSHVEARVLAHGVLLNRGDRFQWKPLPDEAQWSVIYGMAAGDVDNDGKEDLLCAQNDFGVPLDVVRLDGGRGLWLKGGGDGTFAPVPGQESGIKVWGEGRGLAVCDYDGDGRLDVAVSQNGAETKLYRNVKAAPGLRIQLKGTQTNPQAIGATLRLEGGGTQSPVRLISAGSGHLGQNSSIQIFPIPTHTATLTLHWPDGSTTHKQIQPGEKDLMVTP